MIKVNNLTRLFGENKGVQDISFEINKGGIYALLGENSSGKTTLINLLTGMILPSSGEINITGVNKREDYMKKISYFKDTLDLPKISTGENLKDLYNGYFDDFDPDKFDNLLTQFEVDSKQAFLSLSKGNKMLLRLALTLSRDTPYYILDEPLSGIDAVKKELIMTEIISSIDESKILIISSHNLHDIDKSIDEIILIKDTKLIEIIDADTIMNKGYDNLNDWFINKDKKN